MTVPPDLGTQIPSNGHGPPTFVVTDEGPDDTTSDSSGTEQPTEQPNNTGSGSTGSARPRFSMPDLTSIKGGKAKDTPPRNSRSRGRSQGKPNSGTSTGSKTSSNVGYEPGLIGAALANTYGEIGMMVGMFDPQCGSVIVQNAQKMGNSLDVLAKESPRAREFLEKLVTTSAIGTVIAAHVPVAIALVVHHVPGLRERAESAMSGRADAPNSRTA